MKIFCFNFLLAFIVIAQSSFSQQWTLLNSGTTSTLYGIYATSLDSCYAAGDNGTMKTSDQGTTWSSQTVGTAGYRGIYFRNSKIGFIVGGDGTPTWHSYIYKTTDAASNWTCQQNSSPNGLYSIRFLNSTLGYSVGGAPSNGLIFKTTDGGTSWTSQTPAVAQWLNSIAVIDANNAVCVGYNGTIEKTTNGGSTWTSVSSPTTNTLFGVSFPTAMTGYIVGASGTILKTTNGGSTWTSQPIAGLTADLRSPYFFNDLHGFVVGNNGTIIETNNGGASWVQYLAVPTTNTLVSVHFFSPNLGYACGSSGTILKFISYIGVDEIGNNFINASIYPNPTNGFINIEMNSIDKEKFDLKILNSLGETVYEENGIQYTGAFTKHIDLSNLSNGVYFVQMQNEQKRIVKKIILNK